jgi:hypothetical protein
VWTEFDFGAITLALHGGGKVVPPSAGREPVAGTASIGFTVADLDSTVDGLRARGVRFVMEPTLREQEGIRLAVAIDPDGLAISFAQVIERANGR